MMAASQAARDRVLVMIENRAALLPRDELVAVVVGLCSTYSTSDLWRIAQALGPAPSARETAGEAPGRVIRFRATATPKRRGPKAGGATGRGGLT